MLQQAVEGTKSLDDAKLGPDIATTAEPWLLLPLLYMFRERMRTVEPMTAMLQGARDAGG